MLIKKKYLFMIGKLESGLKVEKRVDERGIKEKNCI
jgi:hypothetical protein